jgi:hypothetical protein
MGVGGLGSIVNTGGSKSTCLPMPIEVSHVVKTETAIKDNKTTLRIVFIKQPPYRVSCNQKAFLPFFHKNPPFSADFNTFFASKKLSVE